MTTPAARNSRAVAMLAAGKGRRDNTGCREAVTMLAAGRAATTTGEVIVHIYVCVTESASSPLVGFG